jgi:RecA-family ATPase
MELQFKLGERNGDGRQHVTYLNGEAKYPDCFDADNGFQRRESVTRALRAFRIGTKNVEALEAQLAQLVADAHSAGDDKKALPEILTLRQLYDLELPLPEELIQGILHQGSKLSFGGASKGYKTWTLQHMALAVAGGVPWLGFATRREKVLLIDLELQRPFVKRRLETLQGILNVPPDIEDWLDVWTLRGHSAGHREIFPRIIDRIAGGAYGLVVLDPVYKVYGDDCDENSAGDMAALMNSIERLTTKTGAAVSFGAHYSKGNQASKSAIDRISGSGVFARDPDTLLNLTAHDEGEGFYSLDATLRNFPPMDSFVVHWNFPLFERRNDLDPTKLKSGRPRKYSAEGLLSTLTDGMKSGEWEAAAGGMSNGTFLRLREELESAGKVEKRGQEWWKSQ